MSLLTVKEIEAAKGKDKPYKLMDGHGLQLRVATDGTKTWLVRYMVPDLKDPSRKIERQYRLPKPYHRDGGVGFYSLSDARREATMIRSLAREGIDYQIKLEQDIKSAAISSANNKAANLTVNDLFKDWIETVRRKDGNAELHRSFEREILPKIGAMPLKDLVEGDIRSLLNAIVARGSNRTAVVILNNLKQMFRWGEGRRPWNILLANPVIHLRAEHVTSRDYSTVERDRTLSESEIIELLHKLPESGLIERTQLAIWIMLSCCTRIGETTKAQWKNIDLDKGIWFLPKTDTKNGVDHTVVLSGFSIRQFRLLRAIDEDTEWCFPNDAGNGHMDPRNITKQIRDRQASTANRKPGKNRSRMPNALILENGEWVPHDLRRTGATMMQALGINPDVIEQILNHKEQNRMKRIYQRHDYAKEQEEAWRLLGERLDQVTEISPTASE